MEQTKFIAMVGGDGEFSYQRMGVLQAHAGRRLEPLMAEAVKHMSLPEQGPLHMADFGCSTGRNSISYMNFIVKCITDRYVEAGENNGHVTCVPEMLVSFNDLPGNDFNTLSQLLASEAKDAKDLAPSINGADVGRASSYFSAMVGGSFYNRLLPKESIHFAISILCLHWMSQIPATVTDKSSPLYNKGRSWILGGNPTIAREFAQQSMLDLDNFLDSRAAEMVPGGIVFASFLSRHDAANPENQVNPECHHCFCVGSDFENAWNDLIDDGVITTETRDTFNLPTYARSKEEVEAAIIKCGAFDIQYLQSPVDEDFSPEDELMHMLQFPKSFATFFSAWVRAMTGPSIEAHMGRHNTEEFFIRHQRRITARATSLLSDPKAQQEYKFFRGTFLHVVLKRKVFSA
ncbi:hypothetical protein CY35_07G014400 [Sphagnum magellanicum]|uniref:Uncharacterized protein n=1 Tax=Sphagnum magellanicum TaxID=128215 RepID=A0ACB8HJ30_9BRYO|nr:hypothetical protein CY35_07G014400 [Sphagnum magellanicum]